MRTRIVLIALISVVVVGCGSIHEFQKVYQATGTPLVAGPGDVVLRIDRSQSLPNAFGGADIYGRTTNTGFSQVRFLGVEKDGTVVLSRRDVEIQSNETTMSASRNPIAFSNSQTTAQTGVVTTGNYASATTTANSQGIVVQPTSDYHIVIPPEEIAIRVPPGAKSVPVLGHTLEVLEVNEMRFSYQLH